LGASLPALFSSQLTPSDSHRVFPLIGVRVRSFAGRNVCNQLGKLVCVSRTLWFFGRVCHAPNMARRTARPNRALIFLVFKLRHYLPDAPDGGKANLA